MGETARIYQLIDRARRRLRLQAAFDAATRFSILAGAIALLAVYLYRRDFIDGTIAYTLVGAAGAVFAGGWIWGLTRTFTTSVVAAQIDRRCGLEDRLGTAADFERQLGDNSAHDDPDVRALMEAAVGDAIRHLPRADAKQATPFRLPHDFKAAAAFMSIAAAVALLYFPEQPRWGLCAGEGPCIAVLDAQGRSAHELPADAVEIDEDDLLYSEDLLDDLRRTAEQTGDEHLENFVNEVDELLELTKKGELTKEELLRELATRQDRYMKGSDEDIEQSMTDLEETGKQLARNELTKQLGKALEKGDLRAAQEEFEKLSEKLKNDELTPKQREKLAAALEKTADRFKKKQDAREQAADKKLARKRKEISRLKKKMKKETNEDQRKQQARRLERKQRELQKLERDKQDREKSASKRRLQRLHRNMKRAANDMRRKDSQNRRTQSSRRMKDMARDTGKVDDDRRKVNNQRKVASQMSDMKEALRRARKRGKGMRDKFGKNKRNKDFGRRARGGRGRRDAWKPGGKKPGGKKPGGSGYGTEDGGDPRGDATAKNGNTRDEQLTGVHGRGSSTRETIITAAQKGFASRKYKKVYASYRHVIEEVMRTEKVPSGYRYYIKRYFQKIKPHSMD